MKQASDLTDDEAVILAWFADVLEQDGIEGLARYLDHCRIKLATGMTAGDAISRITAIRSATRSTGPPWICAPGRRSRLASSSCRPPKPSGKTKRH